MIASHPSRGAWIEIFVALHTNSKEDGRTPHGVRGLKSRAVHPGVAIYLSHPSRGAWIEI